MDIIDLYINSSPENPPAVLVVELVNLWPTLQKWLWCFLTRAEVVAEGRGEPMYAIIRIVERYTKAQYLWEGIRDMPCILELIPLAIRLWILEHADPQFGLKYASKTAVAEMFIMCLDAFENYDRRSLDGLFAVIDDQKTEEIVTVTFGHLQKSLSHEATAYCADISVLVHLSAYPSLNRLFLSRGSVAQITTVSRNYARYAFDEGIFEGYTTTIEHCLVYVRNAINEGNGFTWAIQAFKCGIIETMLYHNHLFGADTGVEILLSILPTYFLYEPVAIAAGRAWYRSEHLFHYLEISSKIRDCWNEFLGHVHRASAISGRLSGDHSILRKPGCSFENVRRFLNLPIRR